MTPGAKQRRTYRASAVFSDPCWKEDKEPTRQALIAMRKAVDRDDKHAIDRMMLVLEAAKREWESFAE